MGAVTAPATEPYLLSLRLADDADRWAALGFRVDGGTCAIGSTALEFSPPEAQRRGIRGWTLAGQGTDALDGLATTWDRDTNAVALAPPAHANDALRIDHVVVFTPDLARTTTALAAAGMDLRRTRDAGTPEHPMRQAFYRLGEVILEVVGDIADRGPDAAAWFWGLVVVVPDVDALAQRLGPELVGAPKDAVQPGRRIATVRREAGLTVPLAFLTPDLRHD